jgi:rod shape-determining protein MreC
MDSILGRYRNLIILVGVLFLQVLGLAVQVKRGNDLEHTRLIRIWVIGAITPFERGLVWVENGTGNIWHNYFYLRRVRAENLQLKEEIEQMRLEQVRLGEDAAQAHRLQNLLGFKEQYVAKTVAAQVIGTSGTDSNRVIYIDKGEDAGIRRDMAVITADGVVGKVSLVYPSEAQVLLINDQTSGVGVILADARLQGWLGGTANGEVVLNGVMSDEQVPVGETVLTSGGDRIFPKGLPVGTVAKVGKGKDLFLSVKVKPAANLGKLEEVLVLVEKQERQATADDNMRVRAADILAQRLPSVPDKPATDANAEAAGSATPGATNPDAANPHSAKTTLAKPALNPTNGSAVPKPANAVSSASPSTVSNTSTSKTLVPVVAKTSDSTNAPGSTTAGRGTKATGSGATTSSDPKSASAAALPAVKSDSGAGKAAPESKPGAAGSKSVSASPRPSKPSTSPANPQPNPPNADQDIPH